MLAQADASVGGKTAVDTPYGKNKIGRFEQPWRVYVDVATLLTLSPEDFRAGLAETVKHGVIQDKEFFRYLQQNTGLILSRDPETMIYIAKQNCRLKGTVVEKDEEEAGIRAILNLGHTVGHSIEQKSDYKISHGEAVSMGMMVAGRISMKMGYLSQEELSQQGELLTTFGLPTTIPQIYTGEDLLSGTFSDKKAEKKRPKYVLAAGIGSMVETESGHKVDVPDNIVLEAMSETR